MMVDEPVKPRLGRGLAALLGDAEEGPADARKSAFRVPIEFLRRNTRNPRTHFPEAQLEELAASIRERGIIQPIVVRSLSNLPDAYEIIAGERRWRAAQRAGLHDVPVVVVEADDRLALELAIIENVQRSDLNALEEAAGYEHLITAHGYSQTDLATTLGKSRSHVANTLRLLKLPGSVREMLLRGDISAGHGRALLATDDPEQVAQRVVDRGLTVRDVERLGRDETKAASSGKADGQARRVETGDADTRAIERELEEALGLVVQIRHRGSQGDLQIRYRSLDQFEALCRALRGSSLRPSP